MTNDPRALQQHPVHASMTWHQSNPGYIPPPTWPSGPKRGEVMTYEEWIICQDYFSNNRPSSIVCSDPKPICYEDIMDPDCNVESVFKRNNMWSPRRGHATVVANGAIYVIGGRAREHVSDNDVRIVGETLNPMTVNEYSTFREQALLKNDVWMSSDEGKSWKLVTPGCIDQQKDVLMRTEIWSNKENNFSISGSPGSQCKVSSDCYGAAECKIVDGSSTSVCVCSMFGVREHHSVVVQHRHVIRDDNTTFSQDYMYLIGGYTTVRQNFCSNHSCGSEASYRMAMNDVWVSTDGVTWLQLNPSMGPKGFHGRGGHSSLLIHSNPFTEQDSQNDRLFIFGGEGSDIKDNKSEYLNDIWVVNLTSIPCCHVTGNCNDHSYALSSQNIGVCLPTALSWDKVTSNSSWPGRSGHITVHEPPSASNRFTDTIYLIGGRQDDHVFSDVWIWDLRFMNEWKKDFHYENYNVESSGFEDEKYLFHYHDHTSRIADLKRVLLPLPSKIRDNTRSFYTYESFLSEAEINHLHNNEIKTFFDLSNANLRTVLKLRGFDYPGKLTMNISSICYLKSLVTTVMNRCDVTEAQVRQRNNEAPPCQSDDKNCLVKQWDGCAPLANYSTIDVYGLGLVDVPRVEADASSDAEEIYCKQTPGPRYLSAATFVDGKLLIMGGKKSNLSSLYRDVWSRDNKLPQSNMKLKPISHSTQSQFSFESDEDGATEFEYKLFDSEERLDVTPWLRASGDEIIDVSWLDAKKGGPGSGWYTMYLRAIDASGNRDIGFMKNRNVYTWYYSQPLPWSKISWGIVGFVIFLNVAYINYRRRERKAALERYNQRQMRRKFKLHVMSEAGKTDWKDYYHNQAMHKRYKESSETTIKYESSKDTKKVMNSSPRNLHHELWKERRRERRMKRQDARMINDQFNAYSTDEDQDKVDYEMGPTTRKRYKRNRVKSRKEKQR